VDFSKRIPDSYSEDLREKLEFLRAAPPAVEFANQVIMPDIVV
jgi:hypothetical protein